MSLARPRTLLTAPLVALVAGAALALTGCSGDDPGASEPVPAIQPGGPGEDATPASRAADGEPGYNHADIAFMQMMVPHHAQAIEMSRLARTRASDPAVRRLAARIESAQGPEILAMSAWLDARGIDVPTSHDDPGSFDHSEHGHDPMVGMLTPGQMRALAAADGAEFDRLYLAGMVAHHAGAVAMAETVTGTGVDVRVSEIAADVATGQAAEIQRMKALQG